MNAQKVYCCPVCSKEFTELELAQQCHPVLINYNCGVCGMPFEDAETAEVCHAGNDVCGGCMMLLAPGELHVCA